jgi:hypothetical protein
LYRRNEAVATARQRLNESWILGRLVQRLAQFTNGAVQSDIEVDERIRVPKLLSNFLTRDDLARSIEQEAQNLLRLLGEANFDPSFSQLA